jgi:hypothetical protein
MKMKDFYETLGLTKEASPHEIKHAYRKLSLNAHPDRGGSTERMQLLNEAYEILSDSLKRHTYNANWDDAQNAEVDTESSVVVSGYLHAGNIPPYSQAFRKEHKAHIEQYLIAPLKPISFEEKNELLFESDLYRLRNSTDRSKVSYPHIFALLEAKRSYPQKHAAAIPQKILTPTLAIQLFVDFLAGNYYGLALVNLIDYLATQISQTNDEATIVELYEGLFDIVAMAEMPIEDRQTLIFSINKITDFAKKESDNLMPGLVCLFYSPYFRNLFAYALTLYWNAPVDLVTTETTTQFDGSQEAKELLEVLRERLSSTSKNEQLSELIRNIKLLYLFEKDSHNLDFTKKHSEEYRRSAFHCLDWVPAILENNSRQIFANVFLQIGIKFQQAAGLEQKPAVRMADERLALKMYLTAAGIASHCTPDVEIYINTLVIKCLSSFTYQDKRLKEIFIALKESTLRNVDIFPFFETPKSNIAFFKEDNKTLHLMRHLLNALVENYEYSKLNESSIPLPHAPVTILYQAYVACLNNWYQEEYNSVLENQFRIDLMDELLFDNCWTFLDVEQQLTSPWVMIDRNEEGWINPTRSLPYPTDGGTTLYRAINGAEINYATGSINFYLTPWSLDRPVYEKLFTLFDLQQMLEKNIGGAIFSLDPADPNKPYHPFNQMRFSPNRLLESELLNTMLLTDYILKFLTTAQEVQGYYPFDQRPVNSMIQHLPQYLREIIEEFQTAPHSGALHRFWIEAEELDLSINEQGNANNRISRIGLDRIKMVLKKHRMKRDIHGELNDTSDDEEGWPIYVLTPEQMQNLEHGKNSIEGHAMIFIHAVAKLFYWENNAIVTTYNPGKEYRDTLIRLYTQPRETNGKVIVNTNNMPLIYRVTTTMAKHSGMSHRYTPEFIFTHKFTTHYDEFAQYLPEFGRLKELSKMTVLVRFLNGIRQSNKESLEVLNVLINPFSTSIPSNQEIYRAYQKDQERIHQSIVASFSKWRENFSSSVLTQKRSEQLKALQKEIGALTFSSYSSEVDKACQRWYDELARQNPNVSSSRIWSEIITPKKTEIAQQLSDSKYKSCYDQLYTLFSSSLPSLSQQAHLITSFLKGDIYPLARALADEDKKQVQNEISQQFLSSSTRDISLALDNSDATAIQRISQQESRTQFLQRRNEEMKLAAGFEHIHLGEEEEQETDLTNECLWVPASVRHEVRKDSVTGQSRYSFFVYGGVNIQPRINIIPGGNRPLGGNSVGGGGFNNGGSGGGSGGGFGKSNRVTVLIPGATKDAVRSMLREGKLPVTAEQADSIKRVLKTGRMDNIRIHKMNNGAVHVACERPGHTSGFQRMSFKYAKNGNTVRVVQTAFDGNGKLVHQRPNVAKNNLYDVKK